MDDQRPDSWPVNLAVAALTGVTTAYLPVHRWSPAARWTMHGGMGVLTGAATAYVVSRPEKPTDLGDTGDIASVRPGPGTLAAIGIVLAVVVTGLSRGGEAADAWMERGLTRRGVGRPRAWMGVAAAGASLAMSVAERRQAPQAPREPGATTPPPAA